MSRAKTFAGTTGNMVSIFVQDTTSTTGAGLAIAFNTAGLVAEYRRHGQSSWTAITLVAGTLGTFTSGGLIADGSLTGAHEFCPPDAAFAAGVRSVQIRLRGATNMLPVLLFFELDAVDYQNATNFGLSQIAAIEADTQDIQNRIPSTLINGNIQARIMESTSNAINAQALATDAVNEIRDAIVAATSFVTLFSDVTTLTTLITAARAGYWDNLNVGGAVASQADINALNQSASRRVILQTVGQYERPETGSTVYTVEARTYDGDGAAVNADSNPTLTATGQTTGSLAANVGAITSPATGVYRWTYSVASSATLEPIRFDISATIGGSAFPMSVYSQVVNYVAATWTATDASNLTAIFNKLPSKAYLTGTANSDGDFQANEATGNFPGTVAGIAGTIQTLDALDTAQDTQHGTTQAAIAGKPSLAAIEGSTILAKEATVAARPTLTTIEGSTVLAKEASVQTLLSRIPATLFSGITYLSRWLGALAGKTADASTLTEIQATQAGAGFSNLTDSLEALRDRGDAAWVTGAGGGGGNGVGQYTTTVTVTTTTGVPIVGAMVTVQLNNVLHAWGYTNNAGQIIFNTDPGNFTFLFSATGFISGLNSRTISGNNSFTAQMTAIPITPPPASGLCTVAMKVLRGATAIVGAEVSVRLVDTRSAIPEGALPHLVASFTSNAQGEGTLVLPWSTSILFGKGVYRIQVKDPLDNQIWHDREFTVPPVSTANYMDLPNA